MPNQPPQELGQAGLLATWRRVTPPEYHVPLEAAAGGGGFELYVSAADTLARASKAVVRADVDYRLDTAPGGEPSAAVLDVTRSAAPAAELTVGPGSTFRSREGVEFVVPTGAAPVVWLAGENATKAVSVVSSRESYQCDVRAGEIDTIVALSPLADPATVGTLAVTNPLPASGGVPDMLGAVASNRAVYRRSGESDASLRQRAKTLADMITPAALRRAVAAHFLPLGLTARYVEGRDIGIAADDGATDEPFTVLETYTSGTRGSFVVEVPDVTPQLNGHSGMFCDDGASDFDACDGVAYEALAFYAALGETLRAKKAAGIGFAVVLEG